VYLRISVLTLLRILHRNNYEPDCVMERERERERKRDYGNSGA